MDVDTGMLRHLRLTITKKLALAVILIVIVCIGTMTWLTSQNLQRGFIAYLNQLQVQHLEKLGQKLEQRYQEKGDFEWLRHNRRELRLLLEELQPQLVQEANPRRAARQQQRRMERRGLTEREPEGYEAEGERAPRAERRGERRFGPPADHRPADRPEFDRPPAGRPEFGRPPAGRPELARPESDRPEFAQPGRDALPQQGPAPDSAPPAPAPAPPTPAPAPPADAPPNPLPPPDPMGFAGRLSILDARGHPLIGPPDTPPGIERALIFNGQRVGTLLLAPLKVIANDSDNVTALRFIRSQIHKLLWLAGGMIALAVLLSTLLARHILRPVAGLSETTRKIAAGQFDARAPVPGQDELSELARHVNDMAEALEQEEQRKSRMLADVSHELRTPLSVIRGEIEALQDGIRATTPQALASLHAEVLHLNKLVDDLHQLNLADCGHLPCQRQPFDLVQLLKSTVERFQGRAATAQLRLAWQLPQQAVMVLGDADRINQVLTNLLENSIRYTDPNGQIRVSLQTSSRRVQITIEDSAPGVPHETLARLFDRLYRVDQARSRGQGGSGLGLAICRAIVIAHEGQIDAAPSSLGGVQMTIRLPLFRQSP
jgi:two-component system sensor histidine kinase BaeS